MKNSFFIFAIAFILFSCNKKQEPVPKVDDAGVEITVHDKNNNDLLNPSNPHAYLEENIKIFYLINGVKQEVYHSNYDHPRGFMIWEQDGKYRMGLGLNATDSITFTYIQWNENEIDTLKSKITRNGGAVVCTRLWYKDSLVFTAEDYSKIRSLDLTK